METQPLAESDFVQTFTFPAMPSNTLSIFGY